MRYDNLLLKENPKIMKKVCLILCLLLIAGLLFACGEDDEQPDNQTGAVTTTAQTTPTQGITLDNTTGISVGVNGTAKLTAINLATGNETSNVMWSSDNTAIATVDISGNVRGVSDGTAIITATSIDGKYAASCAVTVSSVVTGIGLDQSEITLDIGTSAKILATIYPIGVKNNGIQWTSSMESVATVSDDGNVTAISNGMTSIIARSLDGDYIAYCNVTVVTPVYEIAFNDSQLMLNNGISTSLTYSVIPADATDKSLVWTSSDESVAAVIDGRITGIGAGKATITATASNGVAGKCEVTVTSPVLGVTLNYTELTLNVGENQQLVATINPTDADVKDVYWSSGDPSIVSVDSVTGALTAISSGSTIITVTTLEGSFTADCSVKVIRPISAISIEGSYHEVYIGDTLQLIENVYPVDAEPEELIWVSSDESIAKVSSTGLVTAISHGTAVITVASKYGAFGSCTVNSIDPSQLKIDVTELRIDKDFYSIYVGEKLTFNITILPENASNKNLTYQLSNDTCATIKDNVLTGVSSGLITVTVRSSNPEVTLEILIQIKQLSEEEIAAKKEEYRNAIAAENERYEKAISDLENAFNAESKRINDILASSGVSGEAEYKQRKADLEKQLKEYQMLRDEAELAGDTAKVNELNEYISKITKDLSNLEGDYKTRLRFEAELKALQEEYTANRSKEDVLHSNNLAAIEYDYQFIKPYLTEPDPEPDPDPDPQPDPTSGN